MKYEHIIWDFNGTILDDVETGIVSVNKLLSERSLPIIESKERYREVFRFPIKSYYETLGFDFEKEPYEVVAPLWVEQYLINVKNADMYSDVRDTLEFFRKNGVSQTVLSATELNMLKTQLSELRVDGYFDEVLGLDNIHAASKADIAIGWRQRHGGRTLLIGDTDHDLQVAGLIGADCALVCRGHQSREYLASLCENIYDDLSQLRLDMTE